MPAPFIDNLFVWRTGTFYIQALCAILKEIQWTMKVTFKHQDFEVDQLANRNIYAGLTSDAASQEKDKIIRFYLSNREAFLSEELVEFLELTGINWTKENEIYHYPIDKVVVVEGWYDVVGRLLTKEQVLSFYWDRGSWATNVYFDADARHGIRDELRNFETFRLDFSIVIPRQSLPDAELTQDGE